MRNSLSIIASDLLIVPAHGQEHIATVRQLFSEYARALNIDLCFQNFNAELADLPGRYAPPDGRLLLAMRAEQITGCGALRQLEKGVCEMKRLYVRPAFRRHGDGRMLATTLIKQASSAGYKTMRLDTLSSMQEAIALYQSLGFQRIDPYCPNPSACAVYMELSLGLE